MGYVFQGSRPPHWDDEVKAFVRPILYYSLLDSGIAAFHVAWDGQRWSKAHFSRLYKEMLQREYNEIG